ncbi:MAG: 3'-5' exonuclease, partial [Planctomycetota bacterium]
MFGQLEACGCLAEDAGAARAWSAGFDVHEAAKNLPGGVRFEVTDPPLPPDQSAAPGSDAVLDDADRGQPDADRHHWRQAAARIKALHEAAPGASIGVLLRSNAAIRTLLHELRTAGLPASGEGGNPIADHPAVAAVLSALVMADHPGDGPAVFHTLNSPVGEVLGLRSPADAERVARGIRAALVADGFAALLADWTRTLAVSCDNTGLRRLTQLIEIAEQYDATNAGIDSSAPLRPSRFVDLAEAARVEEPGSARIRVMTIHKSKGLQFDAVVLPELDKPLSHRPSVLVDRPDPLGPIEHVWRMPKQDMHDAVPAWAEAFGRERARRRAEDFSALYVAMTRPRHGLYLIAKPDTTPRLPKLRFAAILRERLGEPEDGPVARGNDEWMRSFAAEAVEEAAEPPAPTSTPMLPLTHGHAARRMRPAVTPSSLHGGDAVNAAGLLDVAATAAQRRGREQHALLERVRYADEIDPADAPAALQPMLARPAVAAALSRKFGPDEELWRERRFVVADGKRLLNGTFDRVAVQRDAAGHATAAHLIDFKTDRVAAHRPAIEHRVETYRPQLEAYRQALRGFPYQSLTGTSVSVCVSFFK